MVHVTSPIWGIERHDVTSGLALEYDVTSGLVLDCDVTSGIVHDVTSEHMHNVTYETQLQNVTT
jgi:hypothetical protein